MTLEVPKLAQRAMHKDENVLWMGRPEGVSKRVTYIYWGFVGVFGGLISMKFIMSLLTGEPMMMDGEPVTFKNAWPPTLLTVVCVGGFWYLWTRQTKSVRYMVTNQRALIYYPKWGASFRFNFKEGWRRDYTDPESSLISGGYFTPETRVECEDHENLGKLTIGNLHSEMDDAGSIALIKGVIPALDGIIYDPANLQFTRLKNPQDAKAQIKSILKDVTHE